MMRELADVQRAHDMLVAILIGEVPTPSADDEVVFQAAANVLCWVLQHDHNAAFAESLAGIDTVLRRQGYVLHGPR